MNCCWCEQELRELVRELKERGEYTKSRLLTAWGLTHGRPASWQQLATRLQDCCLPRPSQDTPTGRRTSQQCYSSRETAVV
jgi:hypothetical protein